MCWPFGSSVAPSSHSSVIDSETNLKAGLDRIDTSEKVEKPMVQGMGIIKEIDDSTHSITLEHEAIPSLNWPAMTMDFAVDKDVNLKHYKPNDYIQFNLEKDKDNHFVIMEMNKHTAH